MKKKPPVFVIVAELEPVAVFSDEPAARERMADIPGARLVVVPFYEYKVVSGLQEASDR